MASRKNDDSARASDDLARRDLLKAALAVPAAACVTRTEDDGDGGPDGKPKVIVIGAGMAGLTAARRLTEEGYDVTVFERQERKGGRVMTIRPDSGPAAGKPLELGPVFLHGIDSNPVAALARTLGLTVVPVDNESNHAIYDLVYGSGGTQEWVRIDTSTGLRRMDPPLSFRDQWSRALLDFDAIMQATNDGKPTAQADKTLESEFIDSRNRLKMIDPSPIAEDSDELYSVIGYGRFDRRRYGSMSQHSWLHWNDGEALAGSDGVVAEGLGALIDKMAEGLEFLMGPKGDVREIDWSANGQVKVVTADDKEHVAQAVVLAVPSTGYTLGITPELPKEKSDARNRFQGLNANHFYLHFTDLAWLGDIPGWFIDANGVQNNNATNALIRNMEPILGTPTLLVVNFGSKATSIDGTTNTFEVQDEMMIELRKTFPGAPNQATSWDSSTWSAGDFDTWSVAPISSRDSAESRAAIAKADTGRLFWASDVTSAKYPSTLHGAHESGLRAAEQVIAAIEKG